MHRCYPLLRHTTAIVIHILFSLLVIVSSAYGQSLEPGQGGEIPNLPPTLKSPLEPESIQGSIEVLPDRNETPSVKEPTSTNSDSASSVLQPSTGQQTSEPTSTKPASGSSIASNQEEAISTKTTDEMATPKFVDFQRDIVPLLSAKCKECHSGDDAKGGLDITDRDSVLGYITPNSLGDSSLWTDYLLADPNAKDSQVMPPKNPLPRTELSLIKTWIEEGADWPEDVDFETKVAANKVLPSNWLARIWAFQGYFHPAVVHFPVALLIVAAFSLLMSFATGKRAEDFAVFCLVLGSLSACVAAAAGWSFAETQGYPSWSKSAAELDDQTIFWHRWLGILLAVAGLAVSLIAVLSKGRTSRWNTSWKVGVFAIAALVAWVGHQGGELSYGEQLYHDAFEYLMGPSDRQTGD